MGFTAGLLFFAVGGFFNYVLFAFPAAALTKRRSIKLLAYMGAAVSFLPLLNIILFFLIIIVRRIPLEG